jgi:GNAT superfamily N-acetyltransferase
MGPALAVRRATPADAMAIAEIHCAAWRETYPGLLPDEEISRACNLERRLAQWAEAITRTDMRIAIVGELGFACMGAQRDKDLLGLGYPDELYSIYLLRKGQGRGIGAALLHEVIGKAYSILVLAGNDPAIRFYQRMGAKLLLERPEKIGETEITELAFGWQPDHPS